MYKDFFNCFLVFLVVILVDQISKGFAINGFYYVTNEGMMFGSFSGSSAIVRVSLITSGSILFLMMYSALIYFLSEKLIGLKVGLSLLLGGAISNAIDKLMFNFVIDFIPITFARYVFYANLSDVFQIIGVLIILFFIFFRQNDIWFPDDRRGQFLVAPKPQIIFAFKFFVACLGSLLMISLFSYTYMDSEFIKFNSDKKDEFILLSLILSVIFGIIIFYLGVILSHHFYGPIYKFRNYVENDQWDQNFVLREKDQFKELEKIISDLKIKYIKK